MADIRKLIDRLAGEEERFRRTEFVAPCVRGGKVRARVGGMVSVFSPEPADFEGWGVFRAADSNRAALVEEAGLPIIGQYLERLKAMRMRLAYALHGQTWLAYPANESDYAQRFGDPRPVPVHLVSDGAQFEPIIARWDGTAWWFEEVDRRADAVLTERMRERFRESTDPASLRLKGLTPEDRTAYDMAAQQSERFRQLQERRRLAERRNRDKARLAEALKVGGGELQEFRDRGDYWQVEWRTRDGQRHTSAISKRDLTVVSAGICLSGQDRSFDMQSLVGVVEGW